MVNFVRLREGGFLRPWRRIFQTLVQRLSSPVPYPLRFSLVSEGLFYF
jgi:hypothetical protein